jgi:hypothetical protein
VQAMEIGEGIGLHDDAVQPFHQAERVLERERLQLGQSAGANGVEGGRVVGQRDRVDGADFEVPVGSVVGWIVK